MLDGSPISLATKRIGTVHLVIIWMPAYRAACGVWMPAGAASR